jgi:hypothetical protein
VTKEKTPAFRVGEFLMRSASSAVTRLLGYLIAMSTLALAQSGTTSLRGTVTDPSTAAVSGAKVTLASPERGFTRTVTTNATGNYEFLQLQPGDYHITVEMAGFRKAEQRQIQLLVDTPATINMKLEVGTASETVEVSGETPVLNTTDASVGNAFSEIQVKSLPMEGRNVPDLLSLQAGVAYTGNRVSTTDMVDTRSGAVNGARSDQSNITLDGVDVNDNSSGDAFTSVLPITADSVQEFRVTTSNYNSDAGRSSGAQVSLVTKSGTNSFHGAAYEYLRNTITSANDYFVKQSQLESGEPNRPLKLIRNIFGAAVGGPIIKDRLFFFANYEGARQREEQSALRVVPTDALRDGVMMYQCAVRAACPAGMSVQGLSGQSYVVPDDGYFALSPANLIMMDPVTQAPKGPNAVMLQYFQGFPHPNDNTVGYGVNFSGYRFKGPTAKDNDWYIARVDYRVNASGTHTLYWRGGLRNDTQSDVPYLPGTPPLRNFVDYSKGFALGYSATLSNTLLNTFRWGYTRQSLGTIGNNDTQPFILFRTLNNNEVGDGSDLAIVRSTSHQLPINNLIDDISWSRGKHTLQFGTNIGFARQPQQSFVNSFSDGQTNASWLDVGGMATTGLKDHMDPGAWLFPAVSDAFAQGYDYPLAALLGMVTEVDAQYNFQRSGAALPEGAPVNRRFAQNYYEFYGQDTWKVRPNLTVTFGLRYSLFSPPWETNGLQVAPTISLSDWFNQRREGMLKGIPSNQSPLLSFNLAGPANGKAGFYHWDKKDFAPRLAIAWSPEPKTTIRAGFGMVYDHLGQTLLSTFDQQGSFGMSTSLSNLGGQQTLVTAPRLTGLHTIPTTDYAGNQIFASSPGGTFPTQFPPDAFQVYWGMDDKLKTPYSYMLDFSVGHQLQRGFAVQATYVGRLARRLLTQSDLAMPLDLVDPKTGLDYFAAIRPLSQAARKGVASDNFDPSSIGAAAQYWADVIQPLQPGGLYSMSSCTSTGNPMSTTSAAQAVYDLNCPFVGTVGETTTIQALDQGGIPDFNNSNVFYQGIGASEPNSGTQTPYTFLSPQFASLYAWRSNSNSSYHALQLNFRKTFSQGVQFDFNYTFSKSIDLASDAQRIDARGGLAGQIINVWDPNQHRGVSDFDTTHQINLNWIAELPFGRGKMLGRDSGPVLNAVIGGWELSGVARWTSGFPVSVGNGANWPTNWELSGNAVAIGKPVIHKTTAADGSVNLFADPLGPNGIGAFRADFPGESGQRNILRGDGFAGLDFGLSKMWRVRESQDIRFRWEVFNALNLNRFNVATASLSLTNSSTFGNYTSLLTNPRVMQFALRYEF